VVNVGHADLVDAPDGRSWALLLATRTVDGDGGRLGGPLGRETHLVPVDWEAGRPLFAPGAGRVEAVVDAEGVPDQSPRVTLVRDDFDRPALDLEWNTLRSEGNDRVSLTDRPGHLRLRLGATSPTEIGPLSFVGRRLQSVKARISARVELDSATPGEEAGLLLRQSEDAHLALVVRSDHSRGRVVEASLTTGGERRTLGEASVAADGPLELELALDGFDAELSVRGPGGDLTRVALANTAPLASEVAGGFLGVWIGVVAVGAGVGHADFDWFELDSLE
jgi:alpha-N-arabinofuranosidase